MGLTDKWALAGLLLNLRKLWFGNNVTLGRVQKTMKLIYKFITGKVLVLTAVATVATAATLNFNLLSTPTPAPVYESAPLFQAPVDHYATQVGVIVGDGSRGQGTLISPTEVLTCQHLFSESRRGVVVTLGNGSRTPGRVIKADRGRDLALIQIRETTAPYAELAAPGDVGPVLLRGVDEGEIVRWSRQSRTGPRDSIVIDTTVPSGDSGSGVFKPDGLYGVIWGSDDTETYAVAGDAILEFLGREVSTSESPKSDVRIVVVTTDDGTCGPCIRYAPVLDKLKAEGYNISRVDSYPGVRQVPTTIIFRGGVEVSRSVGNQSEISLKGSIDAATVSTP